MRKLLGQLGGTIAGSILQAATLILLLSPAVSHAQYGCWNGPVNPIPQNAISMSPQYWAPGSTFPVVLTSPGGYFPGPGLFWANNYVLTAASLTGGYEGQPLLADDPYVSPSALTWVNSTTITFNVTVLPGAPIEYDAWLMACGALEVYIGPGAPQITPCAVPRTAPVITSITPAIWPAGVTTTVTVTGSNFIPWNDPNGCNPTILTATAPTESGGMNIVIKTFTSTTQFTAAVTPLAADPAETATVTASNYDYNSSPNYIPGIPATAQICPAATFKSVSPNVWPTGKATSITVTGTGFTANAVGSCPASTVTATAADGSAVTVSGVSVASATKITATVTPASSLPTEGATIVVSGAPTPKPNADILGAAIISLNGQAISGPNAQAPDPTPVTGQQLALITTPQATDLAALPVKLTFSKTTPNTWTVTGGTNIGGYTPTSASYGTGSVTKMPALNTPNLTFYSVYPATNVAVTYKYCVSGQTTCPTATASFDVSGPTVSMGTQTSTVSVGLTPIELGFFVPPDTSGITFNATATQPATPGSLIFVQLVDGFTGQYTSSNDCPPFNYGTGLDTQYPYDQSPVGATSYSTNDSPGVPLYSNESAATANFKARMFLMWQPDLPSAIPAPVGFVSWNWSGEAVQNSDVWSVLPGSVVASSNPSLDPSQNLPTWGSVVNITVPPSCH